MPHFTPNPPGYSAEKFQEDVAAMLPFALPQCQKSGRMIACAQCGNSHSDVGFAFQSFPESGVVTDVTIVSVCNPCAIEPMLPPRGPWTHVGVASSMYVEQKDWASFATWLRRLGADALREELGWPLAAKLLHADGPLRDQCDALVFSDAGGNRVRTTAFAFSWGTSPHSFVGSGIIKAALEAALRGDLVTIMGSPF